MNDPVMLSIITPVYNGARFIESCINNVIEQDAAGVEHVIVDGGSTDGTVDIIRRCAECYPHIRWVSEKDRGQSDAMNKGIEMAAGRVIGVLNVDDYYEPGALNFVVERFADLAEPMLLVGNCKVWNNEGEMWGINRPSAISLRNMLLEKYQEAFPNNPSAYFYHKSLHDRIGLYETEEHYAMDVHFIYKALKLGCVTYVDRTLGNYRFIEGTKTFSDVTSGNNQVRMSTINDLYFRSMPLSYRMRLYPLRVWYRLARKLKDLRHQIAKVLRRRPAG